VPLLPLGVPSPPEMHRGIRAAGGGVGARAGGYLLEVARVRTRCAAELRQPGAGRNARVDVVADGAHALTAEVIDLACKGWASTTISRGLFRLVEDGYAGRPWSRSAGWARRRNERSHPDAPVPTTP
jgi:uncharacterized protein YdbL (DUF1318 family)